MLQCDTPLPGVSSSNPSFSKACATFTVPMPGQSAGAPLSLDAMAGTYNPPSHSEWPQGNQSQAGYSPSCLKPDALSIPHQEQTMSLQTSTSSLHQHPSVYRTEKTIDFNIVKQEQKGAGGGGVGKHHPPSHPPPAHPLPPQPSPAQKLSLDKYREKHATELAVSGEKRRQEQHGGVTDCDMKAEMLASSSSTYAPLSMSQVDHRKHSQPHQTPHGGGGGSNTASPLKIKVPSLASGQDRRHQSDKRDKGSLKLRLAVPGSGGSTQLDKSGQLSKDELKMKIKVASSERHSSSDEGIAANNNKSKHSSPLVGKDKHRGAEHNLHRHHKHSHPHTHSGNGRGGLEGPGGCLLRGPPGLVSMEGTTLAPPGSTSLSSSRKRAYPDASHNHHPPSSSSTSCSKASKISKGGSGAAGTSSFSSPCFPLCSSPVLQCVSSGLQLFG